MANIQGVWLPLITPFHNGKIDYASYKKLIMHYSQKGITGFIPNGTTGECPTLEEYEFEELIDKTCEFNTSRLPVYFGLGGNHTAKIIKLLKKVERAGIDGILSVSPYYNRPDQTGIYEHFKAISESTGLNIIVYNIPYRTGRNIENETLFKLAVLKNIQGVKDSCGNINQTLELIRQKPSGFHVLTGEDVLFYVNLALGGDGGILAAAHLATEDFVQTAKLMADNDYQSALQIWKKLEDFIPLLFREPNPAPIKFLLAKMGLIQSDEVRLPLTPISSALKNELSAKFSIR